MSLSAAQIDVASLPKAAIWGCQDVSPEEFAGGLAPCFGTSRSPDAIALNPKGNAFDTNTNMNEMPNDKVLGFPVKPVADVPVAQAAVEMPDDAMNMVADAAATGLGAVQHGAQAAVAIGASALYGLGRSEPEEQNQPEGDIWTNLDDAESPSNSLYGQLADDIKSFTEDPTCASVIKAMHNLTCEQSQGVDVDGDGCVAGQDIGDIVALQNPNQGLPLLNDNFRKKEPATVFGRA